MIKEFCDVCGAMIDTSNDYEYKVKIKKRVYSWDDFWWHEISVCECCKQAIVEKSKEIRSRINDRKHWGI